MSGTRIASTPRANMHALAFQGITPSGSFPQIRDMLLRKFGDEYVLLFARPVDNSADGTIDWYSPVQGEPRHVTDLPPEKESAVRERLSSMGGEIQRYAEELAHSQDPLKVTRGNILKLALCYPDDSALFVVGDQPVFTCWGFGPGTPGAEPANLSRLAVPKAVQTAEELAPPPIKPESGQAPPVTPPPPPVGPGKHGAGCLFWCLPLLLGLALLFLLFTSFAGLPAVGGSAFLHLPGPSFLSSPKGFEREIDLRLAEIDDLRLRLEQHASLCLKTPAISSPKKPAEEKQLVIPRNADDLGFMAGRWRCDTGLANARTNEPVVFEFAFDASGKGKGIIHEQRDRCVGDATAKVSDGVLHISLGPQVCENSKSKYMPVRIECRTAPNGESICTGVNEGGSRWDADFRQVR